MLLGNTLCTELASTLLLRGSVLPGIPHSTLLTRQDQAFVEWGSAISMADPHESSVTATCTPIRLQLSCLGVSPMQVTREYVDVR